MGYINCDCDDRRLMIKEFVILMRNLCEHEASLGDKEEWQLPHRNGLGELGIGSQLHGLASTYVPFIRV